MKTFSGLGSRYRSIARSLGAPRERAAFHTRPSHDGGAHVEEEGGRFAWVVTERGQELERRTSTDPEDVLYWLVSDLTWTMAADHEVAHREAGVDSRRMLFRKHLELLGEVSRGWMERKRREYEGILEEHPFVDGGQGERGRG